MMTVLSIVKNEEMSRREKILSLIRPYKIRTEVRKSGKISVYHIEYRRRRGKIRFDKIYDSMIGKSKLILCDKNINLFNTPFRRFFSLSLNRQLMRNFIIDFLKQTEISPDNLKISYYDPQAEYPSLVEELIAYTNDLTVVTEMPKFYENESDRITEKSGASVMVSNNVSRLYPCDILICPTMIRKPISAAASTLIFTVCRPAVTVSGNIIYKYIADWPDYLKELMPDGIDEDYFMSGLYIIAKEKDLGKYIPFSCGDQFETYTKETIIRRLKAKCMFEVT